MEITAIGKVSSCYKEKFSTPRQSGLAKAANAKILVEKEYSNWDAFEDLRSMDFIWLIFGFHLNSTSRSWQPTVRPPRLGGNKRVGVFATRSPVRPNPLGLSLVKLEKVMMNKGRIELFIQGHDLVEETPIYDIKPYHSQADVPWEEYSSGWMEALPTNKLPVEFLIDIEDEILKQKILQTLELDPRPRYQGDPQRVYGNIIDDYNIQWKVEENILKVIGLNKER
jgi:tRNA-Thr(GGU) m(6)t(6)A37 methyltransferase TsaA